MKKHHKHTHAKKMKKPAKKSKWRQLITRYTGM